MQEWERIINAHRVAVRIRIDLQRRQAGPPLRRVECCEPAQRKHVKRAGNRQNGKVLQHLARPCCSTRLLRICLTPQRTNASGIIEDEPELQIRANNAIRRLARDRADLVNKAPKEHFDVREPNHLGNVGL